MLADKPNEVKDIWNRFVQENILDDHSVRPHIARSWERCRSLHIDPLHNSTSDVRGLELRELRRSMRHLLDICRPVMADINRAISGSGFQIVLSDERGVLLETMGDPSVIRRTRQVQLCPGGNWNESIKGTNAIGTVLAEGIPLQVHAAEHFCKTNHFLTCSAAPIFDPDGRIIGVLDITGDSGVVNPHTLGLAVMAVRAIESRLCHERTTSKMYMLYNYSKAVVESVPEGIVTCDDTGTVVHVNAQAARLLDTAKEDAVGAQVADLMGAPLAITSRILSPSGISTREGIITPSGRRLQISSTPMHDEIGAVVGAVTLFREQEEKIAPRRDGAHRARYVIEDIVGESAPMVQAKNLARRAAKSSSTVLLLGESGTGKELFAQAIHNASDRCCGPFVAIHCAAIPESLIESELFGYEEGAFTGSRRGGQVGKFEIANGGTIFLDEVGDMPLTTQVKLLRVIQERIVTRVGSSLEIPINIRIIAATNKDLKQAVEAGSFRQDLYFRLKVISIRIPALRERREDLPALLEHFNKNISAGLGWSQAIRCAPSVLDRLASYDWPGNVRELESVIEAALNILDEGDLLSGDLIPIEDTATDTSGDLPSERVNATLREAQCELIMAALRDNGGNLSRVASQLGIGRNTLYRRLKEYKLR